MNLYGEINSPEQELFLKALCYDYIITYRILYDKTLKKWFAIEGLKEDIAFSILKNREKYYLNITKEHPSSKKNKLEQLNVFANL